MTPVRLVLGILLATLTALPSSAEELSLRERVERARAAARERAREERKEEAAAKEPSALDPEADPELWRVSNFTVPYDRRKTHTDGRFYVSMPEETSNGDLTTNSVVFLYHIDPGGKLRLTGRGRIVKVTRGRHPRIEVIAETCRFMTTRKRRVSAIWYTQKIVRNDKHPRRVPWYVSTVLKGPDTEGWDLEHARRFAAGQPWIGMSRNSLEAMLGDPAEVLQIGNNSSLTYGTGPDAMRYDITNGVVTGRTPVNQF